MHYHFGWHTQDCRPRLAEAAVCEVAEQAFQRMVQTRDYHVLEKGYEDIALRALLSHKPADAPAASPAL